MTPVRRIMRYLVWRNAVLAAARVRGVPDPEAWLGAMEGTGPGALVPSPQELFESGEHPDMFVNNVLEEV